MPRDLQSLKEDSQPGGSVTNEQTTSPSPMSQEDENSMVKKISETHGKSKRDELHPYTQSLTINDIESCTKLEEATFPPEERCTKEKVSRALIPKSSRFGVIQVRRDGPLCARCCHTCIPCAIPVQLACSAACVVLSAF